MCAGGACARLIVAIVGAPVFTGPKVCGLPAGAKEIRTAGPSYGDLDRATVQGQPRLATRALVAAPPADRLDLVGVDLHAERKLIAKIIHSLRLVA